MGRSQRYIAYNLMGCTIVELDTAHKTLGECTLIIYISKAFSTLVITIYIIIKFHFGFRTPLTYRNHQFYFEERNDGASKIRHWLLVRATMKQRNKPAFRSTTQTVKKAISSGRWGFPKIRVREA